MKIVFVFILLLGALRSPAQVANGDYINVTVNQQILFTYNTAEELLHDKIINNLFDIKVGCHQKNEDVSASVIFTNGGNNHGIANRLALMLKHKTSPNASENTGTEVALSGRPGLLFRQPKMEESAPDYSFIYDLILHPSITDNEPGTYNFSIVFTLSQP